MTWSIVARGPGGEFGIAIASRFFAVGMLCPHARSGVGAVATQALVNPHYGPKGLDLLGSGFSPSSVIEKLLSEDEGQNHRQVHIIDAQGRVAAHTGSACVGWCGHYAGEGFSIAGNMLAGPQVLQATAEAFQRSAGQPLAERLIAAMAAGEAAGGDKRGKQSAALRIHGDEDYAELDLRVDDHAEPIIELQRLYEVSLQRFQPFVACLAGRHDPTGELDRARIEARIEAFHAAGAAEPGQA